MSAETVLACMGRDSLQNSNISWAARNSKGGGGGEEEEEEEESLFKADAAGEGVFKANAVRRRRRSEG